MNKRFRVGFCVSGGGRLFRAAAVHAAQLGIEPALVVAEPQANVELEEFCRDHQVPFLRLPKLARAQFDAQLTTAFVDARLDLLSLTFDKIVPSPLIRHYIGKVINVHPALLPAFAGMRGMEQTVNAGARFAGATIHEADELVDHGPTIAQCVLGLRREETSERLGQRLFPLLRLMYLQVLAWYAEGRVDKDAQGRIWVRDAIYGELPISPALERSFPD